MLWVLLMRKMGVGDGYLETIDLYHTILPQLPSALRIKPILCPKWPGPFSYHLSSQPPSLNMLQAHWPTWGLSKAKALSHTGVFTHAAPSALGHPHAALCGLALSSGPREASLPRHLTELPSSFFLDSVFPLFLYSKNDILKLLYYLILKQQQTDQQSHESLHQMPTFLVDLCH